MTNSEILQQYGIKIRNKTLKAIVDIQQIETIKDIARCRLFLNQHKIDGYIQLKTKLSAVIASEFLNKII